MLKILAFGFIAYNPAASASEINVQSAVYAVKTAPPPYNHNKVCQSNPQNKTALVSGQCNGKSSCDYTVPTPSKAEDPAFGCFKSYQIRYTCSDFPSVVYTVEDGGLNSEAAGKTLKLTCAENGIVVNKASYGENCNAKLNGNRTMLVMNKCQGRSSCQYTVSSYNNGDPAKYCAKTFDVQYQCIGSSNLQKSAHLEAEADLKSANLDCPSNPPAPLSALQISGVSMFVYPMYKTTDNTLFSVNSKFTLTNNTSAAIPANKTISVDIYAVSTNVVTEETPKTKIGDVAVKLPSLQPGESFTWKANTSYVANSIGRMISRTSPSPQGDYYTFVIVRDQPLESGAISIQTNYLPPKAMTGG